ncbi:hypothetical protein HDR66_00925, partial [bacterium]|nr:hypothetical protein [bacterium]
IEQDCNTVATAITEKQKQLKSAVREGSAMLDLARVENRQNHNSDDIATCVANIESAILDEEVCGAGYHKCLDNGEYIDVSTGKPITGVADFYKLGELLTFPAGIDAASQQLAEIYSNQSFVKNFETRTKKFAQPAMDKCVEQADFAWSQYLNKAMLDIYYAQNAKVDEIKESCFDLVAACYMNEEAAINTAMSNLSSDGKVLLQPSKIQLTGKMCSDYVESCNNMFAEKSGDIIKEYIAKRNDTDTLAACRAVAQQCFNKYGGSSYVNFYYPNSGLFSTGNALDWFTLYEEEECNVLDADCLEIGQQLGSSPEDKEDKKVHGRYKSECAKILTTIDACNDQAMIEKAFGGTNRILAHYWHYEGKETDKRPGANLIPEQLRCSKSKTDPTKNTEWVYGLRGDDTADQTFVNVHEMRQTGVATEVYNQIIDSLATSCRSVNGRFMHVKDNITHDLYNNNDRCLSNFTTDSMETTDAYYKFASQWYGVTIDENMCPRDYSSTVDTKSWGMCSCWENGGRRSKNGTTATCLPIIPVESAQNDELCPIDETNKLLALKTNCTTDNCIKTDKAKNETNWCTNPFASSASTDYRSCWSSDCSYADTDANLPDGIQ